MPDTYIKGLIDYAVSRGLAEEADLIWYGWTPGSPVNESFIEEFNKTWTRLTIPSPPPTCRCTSCWKSCATALWKKGSLRIPSPTGICSTPP